MTLSRDAVLRLLVASVPAFAFCSCGDDTGPDALMTTPISEVPSRSNPLRVSPDPIAIGDLPAGQVARKSFEVSNPGRSPRQVASAKTSCPCVSVAGLPVEIEPGRSIRLEVRFDPAEEPNFRGGLAVEILGRDRDGATAFRVEARLTVVGPRTSQPGEVDYQPTPSHLSGDKSSGSGR